MSETGELNIGDSYDEYTYSFLPWKVNWFNNFWFRINNGHIVWDVVNSSITFLHL